MVRTDGPIFILFGASGFVGQHLRRELEDSDTVLLVSRRPQKHQRHRWVVADLLDKRAIESVLIPGCIVINLAYSRSFSYEDNVTMSGNLVHACRKANVQKLVHCSTAVVAGETPATTVSEHTECIPVTLYEKTKHRIENLLLDAAQDSLSVSILRPTEVLGPGGESLKKMLIELETGNPVINCLRSSISGKRQMNLVPVKDVARALVHLSLPSTRPGTYICSADDDPDNRYRRIEEIIKELIGGRGRIKPIYVSPQFLQFMLYMRRNGSGRFPNRTYSCDKLFESGFERSQTIETAVREFVQWERTCH